MLFITITTINHPADLIITGFKDSKLGIEYKQTIEISVPDDNLLVYFE